MLGAGPQGLRPRPSWARRRRDRRGRRTEAAPLRPSRPHPAGGGGPPRDRRGSSAPAGAAAGAARAARNGPARPGAAAAAAAATPETVGAVREPAAGARPQRGEAWGLEAAAAAMPLLFLERFPWPSLRTYTGLSGLALLGTIVSAYRALSQPEAEAASGPGEPEPITASVQPDAAAAGRPGAAGPGARDVAQYLLSDSLFVWVSEAAPGRGGGAEPGGGGGRHVTHYPRGAWLGRGSPPPGPPRAGRRWGRGPAREHAAGGHREVAGWRGGG